MLFRPRTSGSTTRFVHALYYAKRVGGNTANKPKQPFQKGKLRPSQSRRLRMIATYLAKLNKQQRRAVEHGCGAIHQAPPLLIVAGAGSGKTNTLANRVAHLI